MPAYRYRAVHSSGQITEGQFPAANEWELAEYLGDSGLELIEARVRKTSPRLLPAMKRIRPRSLTVFCAQMTDLLKAGVPFLDALREMTGAMEPGAMRDALADIIRIINHGGDIAGAFARYPKLFPPIFTSILSAGEAWGDLPGTFERLTRYAETRARTGEQLRRALRYPLFMCVVALGAVTFMMTMVVPQIIMFLNSISSELPWSTRALIGASDAFAKYGWLAALAVLASVFAVATLRRGSERTAQFVDACILRIPFMGPSLRKVALARFVHSFVVLYDSGLGIPTCLRNAKATLGNRALQASIEDAERLISSGQPLSVAMDGILTPFEVRMIRIGEQCGALGRSLQDVAATCDREVQEMTDRLIGALEPTLTLLVGALLAWIVLAVLGPVYGNLGKLSGMG